RSPAEFVTIVALAAAPVRRPYWRHSLEVAMIRRTLLVACALTAGGPAFAKPCPNIMLVLDQSGSMAQDPDGHDPPMGPSKWEILQEVIVGVVRDYGGNVPFGLELFSSEVGHDPF